MGIITNDFFNALSSRQRKENDLSDVTFSLVKASPFFREKWIRFFFKQLDVTSVDSIEREVYDKKDHSSRADFVLDTFDGDKYVIEVKLWDKNQHFGQYDNSYDLPKEKLGYITNYAYHEDEYEVKEWKSFYDELKVNLKNVSNPEEKNLIEGYCNYLKNVCCIMEINELVDIEKMSSLYDLTRIFKTIVESTTDNFDYQSHFHKDFPSDRAKRISFSLKYKELFPQKTFYPGIGIWYDSPGPRICAGFWNDKALGSEICNLIESKKKFWEDLPKTRISEPVNDGGYFFYLSEKSKKDFKESQNVQSQIDILREFLEEVLRFPLKLSEM